MGLVAAIVLQAKIASHGFYPCMVELVLGPACWPEPTGSNRLKP